MNLTKKNRFSGNRNLWHKKTAENLLYSFFMHFCAPLPSAAADSARGTSSLLSFLYRLQNPAQPFFDDGSGHSQVQADIALGIVHE